MTIRPATATDAQQIVAIYNHGIAERQATFETRPRTPDEVVDWLDARGPFLVAADGDTILGFARVSAYSTREAYAGVGEHTVYVSSDARGRSVGSTLLNALADAAEQAGYHKLTSRVFATNTASRALHHKTGFTEVGIQRRHAKLDGRWVDTVLVERLLGEARDYDSAL
ncbi:arsinothricin resistance N-acetyltransferase ArsN1 [Solirubrobacter taibaiensis]|nr:arsinothricin resistance N-acetyltransferase ArsN1 [Solirubrobacter taibaiensis]